jgi:hypothetical protein
MPSGSPGPRPTASNRPGSASKSSTLAVTFSSVVSFFTDAPQDEPLEAPPSLLEVEAPHFEPLLDAVVSVLDVDAPQLELDAELASVLVAPQLEVDSSSLSEVDVSVLMLRSPPRHARRAG